MHTSVTAGTPRLVTVKPRSKSNGSVQIDREITIVSSPIEEPARRMAMYSTFPLPALGDNPKKESRFSLDTQIRASRQISATGIRTHISSAPVSPEESRSDRRRSIRNPALLEDNRQSMQELADFLRTKEPPPDHYMSIPEPSEGALEDRKRSPFKFFRRQSNRRSKAPGLMKLPDTAVASKTSGGFRHIAISIPIEYDYIAPAHVGGQSVLPTYSEKGLPLRPVTEIYEPDSDQHLEKVYEGDTQNYHVRHSAFTEALRNSADLQDSTVLRYYRPKQGHRHSPSLETTISKQELSQLQKDIAAQSPADWTLQSNNGVDLRHSGGTIYSEQTLTSGLGHSRRPSVSTIAANSKRLTLPPRTSSATKVLSSRGRSESAVSSHGSKGHRVNMSALSGRSVDESLYSVASVHTAGIVDLQSLLKPRPISHPGYGSVSVLPGNADHIGTLISRPSTAPLERRSKSLLESQTKLLKQSSISANEDAKRFINADRKIRLERVKAKKQKDIALLRETSASQLSLSDFKSARVRQGISRSDTSLRTEKARRRHTNAVTPVMLVADVEPVHDLSAGGRRGCISKQASLQLTHTPPQSLSASSESEDEYAKRLRGKRSMESPPYSFTSARSRRQSLLSQHSKIAREREMELDKRLSKIERDNAILLNTLHRISSTFVDLSHYLPKPAPNKDWESGAAVRDLSRTRGLQSIDPLMRELQNGARLSREVPRETRYEDDTDYEI